MGNHLFTTRETAKVNLWICLFSTVVVLIFGSGESRSSGSAQGPGAKDESQYVGTDIAAVTLEYRF